MVPSSSTREVHEVELAVRAVERNLVDTVHGDCEQLSAIAARDSGRLPPRVLSVMPCDRDECSLALVAYTVRFLLPAATTACGRLRD
jgi:hypothetical protein